MSDTPGAGREAGPRRLAVVLDAPDRAARDLLSLVIDAVVRARGLVAPAVTWHYAVPERQPGTKPPPMKAVRERRADLLAELDAAMPDLVLTAGRGALAAIVGKAAPITRYRGRMDWVELDPASIRRPLPTVSPKVVARAPDLYRDLAYDVEKALTQPRPMPEYPVDVYVPRDLPALTRALRDLERMAEGMEIACDVETGGLRSWADPLYAIGIGAWDHEEGRGAAVVVPRELVHDARDTLNTFFERQLRVVFHNAKFDLQFLPDVLDGAAARIGDTMLMAHLLDERAGGGGGAGNSAVRVRGLGLKDQVAVRYDWPDYAIDVQAFLDTPEDERDWDGLYHYCGIDAAVTARLWHDVLIEADEEAPPLVVLHDDLLMPATRALAAAEYRGAPVAVAWLQEAEVRLTRRVERLRAVLTAVAVDLGADPDINIDAPAQVAGLMYDVWRIRPDVRGKHGIGKQDDSVDRRHLEAAVVKYLGGPLDREARWLRALLVMRRDHKMLRTYVLPLLAQQDAGRIHANFALHGTVTGRLSSRGPNLQNVPGAGMGRSGETTVHWPPRRAFAPEPGRVWMEADYSQLELRMAAALSQDRALMDVFRQGRDIHNEVAMAIFGVAEDQVTPARRFMAKTVGFGILYGRSARAFSTGIEMDYLERKLGGRRWTEDEAQRFIDRFFGAYPKLRSWIDAMGRQAEHDRFVESPFGRRRRFPLVSRRRGDMNEMHRQAANMPIQSAASDINLQAMVKIASSVPPEYGHVLFPVHDSVCLEVAETNVYEVAHLVRLAMEQEFRGVPLQAEVKAGPSWQDQDKVKS